MGRGGEITGLILIYNMALGPTMQRVALYTQERVYRVSPFMR